MISYLTYLGEFKYPELPPPPQMGSKQLLVMGGGGLIGSSFRLSHYSLSFNFIGM